jgi:hypothetical protein
LLIGIKGHHEKSNRVKFLPEFFSGKNEIKWAILLWNFSSGNLVPEPHI